MTRIQILQNTNQNIFTTNDLVVLWKVENRRDAIESVKDYIRRKRMYPIKKGIYSLNKDYDSKELAQKLLSPSYISYYTALAIHGIIFQTYSDIHSISQISKTYDIDNQKYIYHKASENILYSQVGIVSSNNYTIASPERAICDSLYLNKDIAFDNLRNIDPLQLSKISKIYDNKRLEKDIKKLIKEIEENVK